MFKKLSAALASTALILAAAPSLAQAAPAPAPAAETLGTNGESQLAGGGDYIVGYVLLAVVAAAFVYGIIQFADDDDSNYAPIPVSP